MHSKFQNQIHEAELVDIFFLGPKSNTPIQSMPTENGPVHVEFSIMRNVMESFIEAELGGLFDN